MSKMNLEEGFYFVLGLVGLIFLKCASLHYTMKLWRWLRGSVSSKKATEPVKKCHDIFEYNFLDEYESQNEGDDSDTVTVNNSVPNTGRNFPDTPHNGIDNNCWKEAGSGSGSGTGTGTGIEVATKNLLGMIRSRRERTAKDLMDTITPPLTPSSGGTPNKGSKNNRDEFSFSTSSTKSTNSNSYLAYLGEVLKDCQRPTRWSTTKPKSPQQQQQEDNANSKKFK